MQLAAIIMSRRFLVKFLIFIGYKSVWWE